MKSSSAILLLTAVVSLVVIFAIANGNPIMIISSIVGASALITCYFSHYLIKKLRANRHKEFEEVIESDIKNNFLISKTTLEKRINQYITIRFEQGRTYIYVNDIKFIQCIHLILNIPKAEIHHYDEIDSIDEAAKLNSDHISQYRLARGRGAIPAQGTSYYISPEQEFWGHCSNIQAWVEHEYDTRILMSNISFPLLRQLTVAGDPLAKKVFKEEIALRLESGYPSVVEYLLNQGYVKYLNSEEFITILETTNLLANISSKPSSLNRLLRSCVSNFPNILKDILFMILRFPDGKRILISSFSQKQRWYKPTSSFIFNIKKALDELFRQADEELGEKIIDCICVIDDMIKVDANEDLDMLREEGYLEYLMEKLDVGDLEEHLLDPRLRRFENVLSRRGYSKCLYCGKLVPKNKDICDWCGHEKDDDEGFLPYPYIFKPPGGGADTGKRRIAIPVKLQWREK